MLKITLLEFFLRGLPEAFLFILAAYTFSKRYINIKRYLIASMAFAITVYMIRNLPIHYGVHVILALFVIIVVTVNINKIDLIDSIRAGIVSIILQLLSEGMNLLIIQYVFKGDIEYIFSHPVIKILYGIPSMLIFFIIVVTYYIILMKKKELK